MLHASMTEQNRQGLVLALEHGGDGVWSYYPYFSRIDESGSVMIDANRERKRQLQRLSRTFHFLFYTGWWRLYAMKREWDLRLGRQVSIAKFTGNIHKIRLRHLFETVQKLKRVAKIASGKSTNPYD